MKGKQKKTLIFKVAMMARMPTTEISTVIISGIEFSRNSTNSVKRPVRADILETDASLFVSFSIISGVILQ